jgi:hypothetical protein
MTGATETVRLPVNESTSTVYPAYNPYFSVCFFNWNNIFFSPEISQQYFSAGLSAQPNEAIRLCILHETPTSFL